MNNKSDFKEEIISFQWIKTIRGQISAVKSILVLFDGRLAACTYETSIKIFNPLNDYECELIINEHLECVSYLSQMEDGKLLSCSFDKSIKIFQLNKDNYICLENIIDAHNEPINKVIPLPFNLIASCSFDKKVKIWSIEKQYQCIKSLEMHRDKIWSILYITNKQQLISCSYNDALLCIWDVSLYSFKNSINGVYCCSSNSLNELRDNRIIAGGRGLLTIVNVNTCQIESYIADNTLGYISSIISNKNGDIICGCYGVLYMIKGIGYKCIKRNDDCHGNHIFGVALINDHILASCSYDSTIKLWI